MVPQDKIILSSLLLVNSSKTFFWGRAELSPQSELLALFPGCYRYHGLGCSEGFGGRSSDPHYCLFPCSDTGKRCMTSDYRFWFRWFRFGSVVHAPICETLVLSRERSRGIMPKGQLYDHYGLRLTGHVSKPKGYYA